MTFLEIFLLIVIIASLICILLMTPVAIIEYLSGPEAAMKLLKRIKIKCSYKSALIIWFICVGVFLVSYFLRKILFQ